MSGCSATPLCSASIASLSLTERQHLEPNPAAIAPDALLITFEFDKEGHLVSCGRGEQKPADMLPVTKAGSARAAHRPSRDVSTVVVLNVETGRPAADLGFGRASMLAATVGLDLVELLHRGVSTYGARGRLRHLATTLPW